MSSLLEGKVALVTGAGHGIGRAHARELASHGATVVVNDLGSSVNGEGSGRDADVVVGIIEGRGGKAIADYGDVGDEAQVEAMVAKAFDEFGHLDIVVNNAGGSNFLVPFLDTRLSGWEKILRLNLDATMWICQAAGAHLTARGSGSVINVASVAGLAAAPFLSSYGVAKAGVVALTKTLASEWGRAGVRVNALCPGWTATELNRDLWDTPDGGQATIANVPMGRWGKPEEMAGPAVFLASEASSFMTGQVLIVDGGQTSTA
jgi:NAD(P)-dependent dehydrogenase (short-subunit alcohol dehydrogenase family)